MPEKLEIGTKVRHPDSGEVGVVVYTWRDDFLQLQDCVLRN